ELGDAAAPAIADIAGLQAALDGKASAATVLTQGPRTMWVAAADMVARTTSGAAPGLAESATHKVMRKTLDFDPAAPEYAQFTAVLPRNWDRGAVTLSVYWTAASGAGTVTWGARAVAVGDGDTIDIAFGGAQYRDDPLTAAGSVCIATLDPVTVAGSPAAGDLVVCQVERAPGAAADTLAVDAQLLGVLIRFNLHAPNEA
ncbi:MAG TPA: hypothetical protein PKZ97_19840, partial [Azospirillaceae bacterium]|nr:hypothetical protein [Azospirillaceae bacterium]